MVAVASLRNHGGDLRRFRDFSFMLWRHGTVMVFSHRRRHGRSGHAVLLDVSEIVSCHTNGQDLGLWAWS